jgi:hypothetical protein
MTNIKLKNPYKIIGKKLKRYGGHYQIPADNCLVVPQKVYGEDISCDVWWKDENGDLQQRPQLLFHGENLEPLNSMEDFHLYELWENCYKSTQTIL